MVYIRLFHGRRDPNQDMTDWGLDGPVFGPYQAMHTTYSFHVKLLKPDGSTDELYGFQDMLFYGGIYYGDWSVFDEHLLHDERFTLDTYHVTQAELPG